MKEKAFDILNQYYYLQYIFSKSDSSKIVIVIYGIWNN